MVDAPGKFDLRLLCFEISRQKIVTHVKQVSLATYVVRDPLAPPTIWANLQEAGSGRNPTVRESSILF